MGSVKAPQEDAALPQP